ncbi:hypothetical protein IFO70_19570 [Phormidium tenue FACHB-886]|nr:hypothetical protein [Phormidium tenue FACHB-886]
MTDNIYNFGVEAGTRNHKGAFVRYTVYKLMGIEQSGWALICQDDSTCHYVDPSCLREMRHPTPESDSAVSPE